MTPDAKVKERIEQLRSQQVPWPDVAQTLQSEGLPSRSGKPWSPFMAMNYIKTNAQSKPVHPSPAKNDEIDTNYSVKSDLEIRIEVLEKRLMLEIHRGIELEAKLAAVNA